MRQFFCSGTVKCHAVSAINFFCNGFNLFLKGKVQIIKRLVIGSLINGCQYFFTQIKSAFTAVSKDSGFSNRYAGFLACFESDFLFFFCIGWEHVQSNYDRQAILLQVVHMAKQIRKASLYSFRIGFCQFVLCLSAVHL